MAIFQNDSTIPSIAVLYCRQRYAKRVEDISDA